MITIGKCPFCGSRVFLDKGVFANTNHFICSNRECHAIITIESPDWIEAIEKFNKRSDVKEEST